MLSELALPVPIQVRVAGAPLVMRRAVAADLTALVALLADDPISASRGDLADSVDLPRYAAALNGIIDDSKNELVVATAGDRLVGTLQLTVIPGMARRGATRLLVEAVRVATDHRSAGIGGAMMRWVIDSAAPAVGADLVQLTSDAARQDAHRFYRRLGFVDSHTGFKLRIDAQGDAASRAD